MSKAISPDKINLFDVFPSDFVSKSVKVTAGNSTYTVGTFSDDAKVSDLLTALDTLADPTAKSAIVYNNGVYDTGIADEQIPNSYFGALRTAVQLHIADALTSLNSFKEFVGYSIINSENIKGSDAEGAYFEFLIDEADGLENVPTDSAVLGCKPRAGSVTVCLNPVSLYALSNDKEWVLVYEKESEG